MLHQRQKALVNQAPSTHDTKRTIDDGDGDVRRWGQSGQEATAQALIQESIRSDSPGARLVRHLLAACLDARKRNIRAG
jgi:hypothetical protein